tara:strand:- start:4111 stop:4713 length:603 start_codon:yes stop_codon:yes gene_type:complete
MKVCPNNMICFRETTLIILLIVLIFLVIFIYQSYNLSQFKAMESNLLISKDLDYHLPNVEITTNKCNDTLFDAYAGPYKTDQIKVRSGCNDPYLGVPVNIKTQSVDSDFRQIGLLTSLKTDALILPLLGRPLITNRDTWQYYALSERNLKLPVISDNKNCTNRYGCNSLSDGCIVRVNGYSDDFKVSMYENNTLEYIPVI